MEIAKVPCVETVQVEPDTQWFVVRGDRFEIDRIRGESLPHSVYDQPDAASVHAQFDRIVDALTDKLPRVAEHLERARADILAFTAFPRSCGVKSGPTTPGATEPGDPAPHRRCRIFPTAMR